MRFDVRDRFGLDLGHGLGQRDHFSLSVDARRRVTHLQRTVVIDGRAADDRANVIAVVDCVSQPLQHHRADTVAAHCPFSRSIKRAAVPVRRKNAFLRPVARLLRHDDRNAARQGKVALITHQTLTREMHRNQRSRTGGLHVHCRPFQVQLVGDERREEVFVVEDAQLKRPCAIDELAIRQQVAQQVLAQAHPAEDANHARILLGIVTGVLQRFPRVLEKEAKLRVHYLRFTRAQSEKRGIELLDLLDHAACRHVNRRPHQLRLDAVSEQLVFSKPGDRLDTVAQVAPELVKVCSAGKTAGHADDCHTLNRI